MIHEICNLITMNPFGSFIVIMSLMYLTYGLLKSYIERNKPECPCECEDEDEDACEDEEVVAMGGEEEDNHHDHR